MATLPQPGNLVLDHRYFLGDFMDRSGNGNDGTPTSVNFAKRPDKHINFGDSGIITITGNSGQEVTQATVMIYGDLDGTASNKILLVKEDASGRNFDIRTGTGGRLRIRDSAATARDGVTSVNGSKSAAVTFEDAGTPQGWINGVYDADFNGTVTITEYSADMYVGASYNALNQTEFLFKGVLFWDVILTADQIAQAHEWAMEQFSPAFSKKNFQYSSSITGREDGALFTATCETASGTIVDKVGGTRGTVTGCTFTEAPGGIPALTTTNTTANVQWGDISDLGTADFTVRALVRINSNLTGSTTILEKFEDGSNRWEFYITAAERLAFYAIQSASVKYNVVDSTTLAVGQWYDLLFRSDRDGTYEFFIDAVEGDSGSSSADDLSITGNFGIGYQGLVSSGDLTIAEPIVFSKYLSDTEILSLYKKCASKPLFLEDFKGDPVSIAAEGGAQGGLLGGTGWKFGDTSGRFKVSSDTVFSDPYARVIECDTAGLLYREMQQAYGTWEWSFYKEGDGNVMDVLFVADTVGGESATGQDCYNFRFFSTEGNSFRESTNGTPDNLYFTANSYLAIQTWYTVRIVRRYDGQFSNYIKGGAFSAWTLIDPTGGSGTNPVTDNTKTTSKFIVLDIDAGDKITDFQFYQGVLDPTT